jgi:hypothetical protein
MKASGQPLEVGHSKGYDSSSHMRTIYQVSTNGPGLEPIVLAEVNLTIAFEGHIPIISEKNTELDLKRHGCKSCLLLIY